MSRGHTVKNLRNLKRRLFMAQGGRCVLCNEIMRLEWLHPPQPKTATFEHVEPRRGKARRGARENLALSHSECNHRREMKPLTPEQMARVAAAQARLV